MQHPKENIQIKIHSAGEQPIEQLLLQLLLRQIDGRGERKSR